MRLPQALIDAYRREGLDVPEYPGWRTRGVELAALLGLVWHHTATPSTWSDQALRDLCAIRGNATTPPPLTQFVGERDGQLPVLAAGKCNHNGFGTWGNSALALELANNGVGEPYPDVQIDRALRWSAVTCLFYGWHPDTHMRAHKETDPTRKIDPAGLNMNAMRAAVGLHMLRMAKYGYGGQAPPPPPPVPTSFTITRRGLHLAALQEDLMRLALTTSLDDQGRGWLTLNGAGGTPDVPFGDLISVRPLGSAPGREGYWPIPETAEQDAAGKTLLTIEGGSPRGQVTLFLVVPDVAA